MNFLASHFGAPCPKKEQKMLFAALILEPRFLNFGNLVPRAIVETLGPRVFFMLGFAFGPLGPTLFGSRAETGNEKPVWGLALWGLDF